MMMKRAMNLTKTTAAKATVMTRDGRIATQMKKPSAGAAAAAARRAQGARGRSARGVEKAVSLFPVLRGEGRGEG
jgi:hypothetical protein